LGRPGIGPALEGDGRDVSDAQDGAVVITLWAAITLNFALPRLMPGSPVDAALAKLASSAWLSPTPRYMPSRCSSACPNTSLLSQYGSYLKNIATLNFGTSILSPARPSPDHRYGVAVDAGPGRTSTIWPLSSYPARCVRRVASRQAGGRGVTLGSTLFAAFPTLLARTVVPLRPGVQLEPVPAQGGYNPGVTPTRAWRSSRRRMHSALPALTLVITALVRLGLGMRNNMINTLGEDYVTLREANGLRHAPRWRCCMRRNALLPNVTAFGLLTGRDHRWVRSCRGHLQLPGLGNLLFVAVNQPRFPR